MGYIITNLSNKSVYITFKPFNILVKNKSLIKKHLEVI